MRAVEEPEIVPPAGGPMRELLRVSQSGGRGVAHLLRETFGDLDLGYPPADFDVAAERRRLRDDRPDQGERQVNDR
ncbi:hypothetical protein ABGB16_26700 [Micromonospora sp. B11E3]|uniref:hypothetical protein n=1 Tax=Micromonospora sp. B11E3 TaxID=3153562 RepID=UPI00325F6902